ncbi:MAG: LysM peptidoglycan-binding domain-containing protein, partial [Chloroflexota bacterium]|nr:LysM peptidoglycan-binding domain-containing protein [Chloroflexota bacterium]
NPSHIHPYNWLYIGHTLWIPCGQPYPPHPPPPPHPPQPPHPPHPPSGCGYWYTVQYGDSWSKLAARTGISMYTLKGANPAHIHPYNWLYAGHRLWIPCAQPYPPHPQPPHPPHPQPPHPPQPPMCQYYYTVLPGDSWYSVCNKTGVSVSALQNANPSKVRPPNYWLYAGETLCIPGYAY